MDEFIDVTFSPGSKNVTLERMYQYDRGRKLRIHGINNVTSVQVHYSINGMMKAMLNVPTVSNNVWTSDIPNSLAMQTNDIQAYIYIVSPNSAQTVMHVSIPIEKRPKPEDFEYTEEELKGLNYVIKQLQEAANTVQQLNAQTIEAANNANEKAELANNATNNANNATAAATQAATEALQAAKQPGRIELINQEPETHKVLEVEDIDPTLTQEGMAADAAAVGARIVKLTGSDENTAKNSDKFDGKPASYYLPAVQLLDNPDFAIAQAGYGGNHGTLEYACDRWRRTGTAVIEKTDSGMRVSADPTSTRDYEAIWQKLNDLSGNIGKSYTLAACINGNVSVNSGKIDADGKMNITAGSGYISVSSTSTFVQFNIPKEETYYFSWIALYEGTYTADTLPPFVPRPYATELAECQRYYFKATSDSGIYGYIGGSGTTAYVFIPLPVAMRLPNVSLDSGANLTAVFDGSALTVTTFTAQTARLNQLELKFTFETARPPATTITGWVSSLGVNADL